jgi:hypothetical protein
MKATELKNRSSYRPWMPRLDHVPHMTIETNMTCNISCNSCYNHNHSFVKTLKQIQEEISTGLQKRKADTISILGGEPTLHPEITEVVRYIKSKGAVCQILTNGYCFINGHNEKLMDDLINAGLDRFIIHIDKGQEVYPDAFAAIHQLLSRLENKKVMVSVAWTVYKGSAGMLPELIREFSHYKNFDGILSVLSKDINESIKPDYDPESSLKLKDEYDSLSNCLQLQPSLYLPSNLSSNHIKWFLYVFYMNKTTFKTFYISPALTRIFQSHYLRSMLRVFFRKKSKGFPFLMSLLITGILEILINPKRIKDYFSLLRNSGFMKNISFKYLNIQDGPEYDHEFQKVSMCYHCPDATIRNGKITPICLADRINPLPGSHAAPDVPGNLRQLVYSHLEQEKY